MMLSRRTALLAALVAGILAVSGALAMLGDANGTAHGATPPQIDAFDLMSNAWGLPDLEIENLF